MKLNIELTMANLIAKIACSPQRPTIFCDDQSKFRKIADPEAQLTHEPELPISGSERDLKIIEVEHTEDIVSLEKAYVLPSNEFREESL